MNDPYVPITVSSMQYRDLKHLIRMGEGSYLEFKKTTPTPSKIAREMVAFANTGGGTLLIGVADDGQITGVEAYFEEEYLLQRAAGDYCLPALEIRIELVHTPEGDVMAVRIPEAGKKPVMVKGKRHRQTFVRRGEESVLASDELVEVLRNKSSDQGVTFEYGENERKLFRYLNEYGEITVQKYSHLINETTWSASRILINLVSAGVLKLSNRDNLDYFTFSQRNSTES